MNKQINELAKRVADYLGVEELPIVYDSDMVDDSRLDTSDKAKIVINQKYKDNYIESAKCVTHEYRHAFQIYWAALMPNDEMAILWKEELAKAKTGNESGYDLQAFELDAFAFTYKYLKECENIETKVKNDGYQKMIEVYTHIYNKYL